MKKQFKNLVNFLYIELYTNTTKNLGKIKIDDENPVKKNILKNELERFLKQRTS